MPRKEKKFHFIYKTTNTITGRYYYGMHSTNNLEDGYMGSGKRLRYSINKYGESVHYREILEFCDTREDLAKREKEIVNLNEIAKDKCMNLGIGGNGGYINPEQARKGGLIAGPIQCKMRLKKHLNLLKTNSTYKDNFSKSISKALKGNTNTLGLKHTKESKEKMSKSHIGSRNSQYGTCWITNGKENKKINKNDIIPSGWYPGRKCD